MTLKLTPVAQLGWKNDEPRRYTIIKPGTLPTRSALFGPAKAAGTTVDSALTFLRLAMKDDDLEAARDMLNILGFDWAPSVADCPKCGPTCICDDIANVPTCDCAATIAALRCEVQRLRAELWLLRDNGGGGTYAADATPLAKRAAVLGADE